MSRVEAGLGPGGWPGLPGAGLPWPRCVLPGDGGRPLPGRLLPGARGSPEALHPGVLVAGVHVAVGGRGLGHAPGHGTRDILDT